MVDDPLAFAISTVLNTNNSTSRYVSQLLNVDIDDIGVAKASLTQSLMQSQSSRRMTYRLLNPSLETSEIYCKKQHINEIHRISYTQFCISGHSLAVETGRWNRRGRGRLPMEERLCPCGAVQTEVHVIESCPLTNDIRLTYGFNSWQELQNPEIGSDRKAEIVYMVLSTFN